ncbi:MAG TPA: hypothetical protein ENH65_01195 [Candidatus Aminicenantes bacterium]|nr:hypothetical protein [Candidatus Aminicenantes bacterium]
MEIVWQALHIMDWYQTRQIVDDPNYWEMNPLIGKDPTRGQVNSWMAGFAVGHLVTSHFLPKEYKKWFQGISLGAKGATVIWNYRVGLKF